MVTAQLFPMNAKQCLELARARNQQLGYDELVLEVAKLRTANKALAEVNHELSGLVMRLTGDSHE